MKNQRLTSSRRLLMALALALAPLGAAQAQSVQVPSEGTTNTLETLAPENVQSSGNESEYQGAQGRTAEDRMMMDDSTMSPHGGRYMGAQGPIRARQDQTAIQSRRTSIQVQEGFVETLRTLTPEVHGLPRQSTMGDPTTFGNYSGHSYDSRD